MFKVIAPFPFGGGCLPSTYAVPSEIMTRECTPSAARMQCVRNVLLIASIPVAMSLRGSFNLQSPICKPLIFGLSEVAYCTLMPLIYLSV